LDRIALKLWRDDDSANSLIDDSPVVANVEGKAQLQVGGILRNDNAVDIGAVLASGITKSDCRCC